MSQRHFRYQSVEELEQEIQRLGLQVALETDVEKIKSYLGRPVRIGAFKAGNSLGIHPWEGCDGSGIGEPDGLVFRRCERSGRGGAKLSWFEATAVVPEGRPNPRQLLISDYTAKSLQLLLDRPRRAHREVF